jgi:hypothetical protein
MEKYVKPGEASRMTGYTPSYLRRLANQNLIKTKKTNGTMKWYLEEDLMKFKKNTGAKRAIYVENFNLTDETIRSKGYTETEYLIIREIVGGRTKLKKLLKMVESKEVTKIYMIYPCKCFDVYETVFEYLGIKIKLIKIQKEEEKK